MYTVTRGVWGAGIEVSYHGQMIDFILCLIMEAYISYLVRYRALFFSLRVGIAGAVFVLYIMIPPVFYCHGHAWLSTPRQFFGVYLGSGDCGCLFCVLGDCPCFLQGVLRVVKHFHGMSGISLSGV